MLPSEPCSCGPEAVQLSFHPESSERRAAALAKLLWSQWRPQGVRDGVLFSGVRLEACEVVEEAQCRGVELSGGRGDDRHEPVVLGLKPLVVLGHHGAVGPVELLTFYSRT